MKSFEAKFILFSIESLHCNIQPLAPSQFLMVDKSRLWLTECNNDDNNRINNFPEYNRIPKCIL